MQWRLITVFAFGAATGIAACLFVARYQGGWRPGWNANAITASVRSVGRLADGSFVIVDVALANKTATDYKIARSEQLNIMLRTSGGLYSAKDATIETPIFLPVGQIANFQLRIPALPLLSVAFAERKESQSSSAVDGLIPPQVTAIELFDEAHRYMITIPRKW